MGVDPTWPERRGEARSCPFLEIVRLEQAHATLSGRAGDDSVDIVMSVAHMLVAEITSAHRELLSELLIATTQDSRDGRFFVRRALMAGTTRGDVARVLWLAGVPERERNRMLGWG